MIWFVSGSRIKQPLPSPEILYKNKLTAATWQCMENTGNLQLKYATVSQTE